MRVLVVHPGPGFSVADVYNGWVKGLRACGVEVVEYRFDDRVWHAQRFHLERDGQYIPAWDFETACLYALEPLGAWIYETQPDVVLFISGFWIRQAPFDLLRARGQKVALLCTESPYEDDVQIDRAGHVDICLLNDPTNLDRFRDVCPQTVYVPHSYDPDLHRPGPVELDKQSDLCIVGTGFKSRVEFLGQMDLDGLDVAFLGNWMTLEDHPLRKYVRQHDLDDCCDNAEAVRWYNSTRASLNLYRRESNRPDLSAGIAMGPREVELAASGTFFLTEARDENCDVLPFVPKVATPPDATEQLRWWLDHPNDRNRVIVQARDAVAGWTFTNRAAGFLRLLEKQPTTVG